MREGVVPSRFGKQWGTGTAKNEADAWRLSELWLDQFLEKERLLKWADEKPPLTVPVADRDRFEKIRQKMVLDRPRLPGAGGLVTQHWADVTDDDLAFLDRLKKSLERDSKRPDSST
jgi:hypothetical protein